jgi:hypothetical protein
MERQTDKRQTVRGRGRREGWKGGKWGLCKDEEHFSPRMRASYSHPSHGNGQGEVSSLALSSWALRFTLALWPSQLAPSSCPLSRKNPVLQAEYC